jgi:hypothetical protein
MRIYNFLTQIETELTGDSVLKEKKQVLESKSFNSSLEICAKWHIKQLKAILSGPPPNVYVSFDHIADGLTKIDTIAAKYEKDLQDAVTRVFSSRCTTCIKFF